jgi:acetyltransferase
MESEFTAFDVTLCDGRAAHIRAMRVADEAELLQAFERLSPDARYMRFMRAVREPNLERLRKAIASFPESGLAIVATVPAADGFDVVGSSIFVIGSDPATCEFAITIAADYNRARLGRTLLKALIDAARRRGLREMEGFVLTENIAMLRLAVRVGFTVSPDPEDPTVRICHLRL